MANRPCAAPRAGCSTRGWSAWWSLPATRAKRCEPPSAEGQSGSVRAGLEAVAAGAAAVVFAPCDQPFLAAGLVDELISRHQGGGAAIVVPAWRGRRGAPVLIGAPLFDELTTLRGDAGARQLFARHAVAEVELVDEAPLRDFDTEEELAALLARRPAGGRPIR